MLTNWRNLATNWWNWSALAWDYRREGFELALGIGHHKDSGVLIVLAQDDVGGLEVKRKRDGEWVPIKQPISDSYVVNDGDITHVCSNTIVYMMPYSLDHAQINFPRSTTNQLFFLRTFESTLLRMLKTFKSFTLNEWSFRECLVYLRFDWKLCHNICGLEVINVKGHLYN